MRGRVIKIESNRAELTVFCDGPAEFKEGHCGVCNLALKSKQEPETVIAENTVGAKVGDIVELRLKEHAELKSAVILLVLPLLIFLAALSVANSMALLLWDSVMLVTTAMVVTYVGLKIMYKNKTYYYLV